MAAHEAAGDLEILFLSLLTRLEYAANARRVHGEGFFHEHMHALGHGVLDVDWPECRRRGKQDHVAFVQRIYCLLKTFKAGELAFRRDVQLLLELWFQVVKRVSHALAKEIRQRPEFGGALGGKCLCYGATTAPTTTDECNLDGVVLCRIGLGGNGAGQRRACGSLRGG